MAPEIPRSLFQIKPKISVWRASPNQPHQHNSHIMPSTTLKRRWTEEGMKGKVPKKQKKIRKQKFYHSSSEDEDEDVPGAARDAPVDFKPVNMEDSDEETTAAAKPKSILKPNSTSAANNTLLKMRKSIAATKKKNNDEKEDSDEEASADSGSDDGADDEARDTNPAPELSDSGDDDSDSDNGSEDSDDVSETSTNNPRKVRKRNDPEAFATSISKILNSKLTTKNRSEPILARSIAAQKTNQALSDHKLTEKAHRKLLAEKKAAMEKGRVKDVLGLDRADVSTADIVAEEKRLKRTAQKGVIKLFNAVRAAQVKAEIAQKEVQKAGVVGMGKREEKVQEMSKQGFLDMIAGGGKTKEGSVEA